MSLSLGFGLGLIHQAPSSPFGANIVSNSTFETDVSGYTQGSSSTLTWDASKAASNVTTTVDGSWYNAVTEIGKTYRVWVDSKFADVSHKIRMYGDGSLSGGLLVESANSLIPTTFSVDFTAINVASSLYLRNAAAGTVFWDNVFIREIL